MMSDESISSLIEAQFTEGGEWVLSRGTVETITGEKFSLFKKYQDQVTEDPPGCLSTLRRMLQAGPVTKLYSGGGGKFGVPVHGGFSLACKVNGGDSPWGTVKSTVGDSKWKIKAPMFWNNFDCLFCSELLD